MEYEFRPLLSWPHASTQNRNNGFRAGWSNTLDFLEREIERLKGERVVIATLHSPRDIRKDGMVRGDARQPSHPGVEISFDTEAGADPRSIRGRQLIRQYGSLAEARKATHPDTSGYESVDDFRCVEAANARGRMVLATDAYWTWQQNVRAVAFTLESMRALDRYGATRGKQYAGFTAQLQAG